MSHLSGLPRLMISVLASAAIVFLSATPAFVAHAQATDPLAQQWADKRVELERITFLRRSWQISDAEYRERTNQVNVQIRDLGAQIAKMPPAQQAQIRQQQDSVFTVVIIPLREQWQQQTKDRETKIRADIATDAKIAADLQANRTLLNEKLQRKEISQADFSSRDQTLQQQLVAMQNKWASLDPGWGNLFTGSWQRLMPTSLADLRKKDAQVQTAGAPPQNPNVSTNPKINDNDVRTAVGILLDIQHNIFLRDKQVITAAEEQKRDAGLRAQVEAIQAKYSSTAAKDFTTRVAGLVDAGVVVRKSQWEKEASATAPANPSPPTTTAPTSGGSAPPIPSPPSPTPNPTPHTASTPPKAYLKEMPDAGRVMREVRGRDPADTVSQQLGAFTWLQEFVFAMNGIPLNGIQPVPGITRRLPPEDQQIIREYTTARNNLMGVPHYHDNYSLNRRFRYDVLQHFFPPQSAVYRANFDPNDLRVTTNNTHQNDIWSRLVSGLYVLVYPALVLVAVAVGFVFYRHQATKSRQSPAYHQVKADSIPTQAAPQRQPPRKAAVATAPPGDFRRQLFADQKEKYQARYNDVVDEMTAASMELSRLAPLVESIRNNLRLLSKASETRLEILIQSRYASTGKLIRDSLLLMPLWRLFKRFRLIGKIILAAILYYLIVQQAVAFLLIGQYLVVLIMYVIVAAILFLVARHQQIKLPLGVLKKSAEIFKNFRLNYVYENQSPHLLNGSAAYLALRVSANAANVEDCSFYVGGDRSKVQPGATLLTIGDVATYFVDRNGSFTCIYSSSDSVLMNQHGALLTEALNEQTGFATTSLQPLADYALPAWQKRRASEEIPRIEKLIKGIQSLESVWRDTYTSDKVFEFLLRRIDLFNMGDTATPPGLLLYGYPGNGKTHLVKKIAESLSARLEQVNGATLTSAEQVKSVWEKNRGKGPVVLFVKNAGQVFPKPGSENQSGGTKEATMTWVAECEKFEACQSRIWVVMTAQSDQELHPDILAQFSDSKIEVAAPDAEGREMILRFACRENKVDGPLPSWIARGTSGATIRELQAIVKAVKRQSAPNLAEDRHWRDALKTVRGSEGFDERALWVNLIIGEDTLKRLKTLCESLRSLDTLQKQGHEPPRGALFFGPPGTGKTQIARTLANESGLPFIAAAPADLKAGYVGQSGQKVQALFEKARGKAPCILFIDEFDSSAAARGSQWSDQFTDEIVNGLLAAMDGVQKSGRHVFVVAATNYLERIDPAILSRFMYKIEIPNPDAEQRTRLFKVFLGRQKRIDFNVDEMAAEMSQKAGNISGRDIDNLVRAASQAAMERAFAEGTPDQIVLTRKDLLAQLSTQLKEVTDEQLQKIWSKIILRAEVKESILSKIRMFNSGDKAAPRGLLLYGPPGTGKSEIARRIAESTNSHFESLTISSLKAGYTGQTGQRVKQIWDKVRSRGRCVMFVDECEGVFARRGGLNTDSFSEELIQEFLAQWDGVGSTGQVWVVGATNRRDLLDDAIMSRFGAQFEIGLPEAPERLQILRLEMQKLERDFDIPEFVGAATTGAAGRDLANLARDVCTLAAERRTSPTPEIWKDVIARSMRVDPVDENARWDRLVISAETLRRLKTICESLRSIEDLRKQDFDLPRGAILYGPPGTGKTQIARTLANESGLSFVAAGPVDMKGIHVGESGQKVRELFDRARAKSPCILFIDEFESSAPSRGGAHADQYTNEIVNELLTQMDGVKKANRFVFVLAATNYLERIDEAVASRFNFKTEVPNPDAEQRKQLFKIFLAKKNVNFDVDEMAGELARKSGNIGGRAIRDIITAASQRALERAFETGNTKDIVITREDLLAQFATQAKEVSDGDLQKIWSQIVLKPDIKKSILSKIRMFNSGDKATPRGLLLYGPPGTGKTEIARRIADSTNCAFESLSIASLKAGYTGQSGQLVKQIWDKARSRGRAVIFVDECEGVFGRRGGLNTDSFSEEIIQEFLAQWDGVGSKGQIWIIGATNRRDMLDEAIVSRFGAAWEIGLPDAAERLEILRLEMRKLDRDTEVPEFVGALTNGLAGRGLATVARDVCTLAAEQKTEIIPEMWRQVLASFTKSSSDAVDESARWSQLILPDELLKSLKTLCDSMRNAEILAKQGFEPLRGALLSGPPGTGKTQIARTLANESGVAFIAAGPADLKAGYLGQSVQKVNELFQRARAKAPCILFIDEIEACCADRNGPNADQYTNEIVTEFLRQMDGVKKVERYIFVLAATNHPKLVDPAIVSRFEQRIEIRNPGPAEREQLFKIFLSKYRVDFDVDATAAELATTVGDVGGRDIQSLVRRASQLAVQRALEQKKPDQVTLTRQDLITQINRAARAEV